MKAKTNRRARRALGLAHWATNRSQIALSPSHSGEKWLVVKKKK
ncbi:stationary-phase-induced ribosome-associated protein [Serratia liquefaciens]|nr:stationary-phase-induced ribosome-associated protein [Serratia liquefaciens]